MKKVISFSLFGERLYYRQYLPAIIRSCLVLFPGWEIRVYHDETIFRHYYGSALISLYRKGIINLIYMGKSNAMAKSMLWRLAPLWDENVELFLCRDLDYIPTLRERFLIEEFIQSKASVHTISDHDAHGIELMGGMIGFKNKNIKDLIGFNSFNNFFEHLDNYKQLDWFDRGADQYVLCTFIWNKVKHLAFAHTLKGKRCLPDAMYHNYTYKKYNIDFLNLNSLEKSNEFCPFIGTGRVDVKKAIIYYNNLLDRKILNEIEDSEKCSEKEINSYYNPTEIPKIDQSVYKKYFVISVHDDNINDVDNISLNLKKIVKNYEYHPLILMIGSPDYWYNKKSSFLFKIRESGADMYFIPFFSDKEKELFKTKAIEYSCALNLSEDTILTAIPNNVMFDEFDKYISINCKISNTIKNLRLSLGIKDSIYDDATFYNQKTNPMDIMYNILKEKNNE